MKLESKGGSASHEEVTKSCIDDVCYGQICRQLVCIIGIVLYILPAALSSQLIIDDNSDNDSDGDNNSDGDGDDKMNWTESSQ